MARLACLLSLLLVSGTSFASLPVSVLHSLNPSTDGSAPQAALVLGRDGNFYGTTGSGGASQCSCGTVFRITPAGAFSVLHTFTGPDGNAPSARLVQGSDGNFYGTTRLGGDNGSGTIFRISASGTFKTLHSFAQVVNFQNADGSEPVAPLILGADGNFYGTALVGGFGNGTIFRMAPDGTVTVLHKLLFEEGGLPAAGLVAGRDGFFYGSAIFYGQNPQVSSGSGTVFRLAPDGSQFGVVHVFDSNDGSEPTQLTFGADGALYGTTVFGGSQNIGTVFRMTTNGVVTTLHDFLSSPDGNQPHDGLLQGVDGNFYGTTIFGGGQGGGVVYKMTPAGAVTVLHDLGGPEGFWTVAGLARGNDGNFYGVTPQGGDFGGGAIFRIAGPVAAPTWVSPPTPSNGTVFNLTITRAFSMSLRAKNGASLEMVHIGAAGVPAGATFNGSDGNPADAALSWTPAGGQAGDYTVTFTANNVAAPVLSPPTRTVKLHVSKRVTAIAARAEILETDALKIHLRMNAVLTATDPSEPLAGEVVRFEGTDGSLLCAATTDATGHAVCGTAVTYATTIVNRGYYARFAGDNAYTAASAFGYLITN